MMEVLEGYLRRVARFLPASERQDIIDELSENIRSHVEDREAELGRPLTDTEQKELLEQYGDPLAVAARYRPDDRVLAFGRVLVGPVLFPLYRGVLAFNVGLTAAAVVAIGLGLRTPLSSLVSSLLFHVLLQSAMVTVVFVIADRGLQARLRRAGLRSTGWPLYTDVFGELLAAAGSAGRRPEDARGEPRVPRLASLAQIAALALLLASLPAMRALVRESVAEAGLALTSVWAAVPPTLAALWIASMGQAAINLVYPGWVWLRDGVRVATDLAWLVLVSLVLAGGTWVVPGTSSGGLAAAAGLSAAVNRGMLSVLVVVWLIALGTAIYQARAWRRGGVFKGR